MEINNTLLPELCYGVLSTDNTIIIIKRNESGYYKTDWPSAGIGPEAYQKAEAWKDKLNAGLGVSIAQARCMLIGSMFGWDTPGANPMFYDENGSFNLNKISQSEKAKK